MKPDDKTVERVRKALTGRGSIDEKKMMGTLAFLVDGALCCAVRGDALMVRVDAEARDAWLAEPHVTPTRMRGRVMTSFIVVEAAGISTPARLERWLDRATRASPRKPPKRSKKNAKPRAPSAEPARSVARSGIVERLVASLSNAAITVEPGWGSGNIVLKAQRKIFAIHIADALVFKLPKARVDELVAAGQGQRFDPRRNGKVMKEWVVVPATTANALRLGREAHDFSTRLSRKPGV